MKCPKCQNEMTQLLVSWICDTCNPLPNTEPTQQISSYDRETIFHRVKGFIDTRIKQGYPFLIAGGAGLFMEGFTNKYGDVDVFVPYNDKHINDDVIDELTDPQGLFKVVGETYSQADRLQRWQSISAQKRKPNTHNIAAILEYKSEDKDWDKKVQLIFVHDVSDPQQIIEKFDWNFCQVGIDETRTKITTRHFDKFRSDKSAALICSPSEKLKEPKVWTRLFKHAIQQDIRIQSPMRYVFPVTPFGLSRKQIQMLVPQTKFKHHKYTKRMVMEKATEHCWGEMKLMIDEAARHGEPLDVLPSRHNEVTFIHNIITFWSNKFSNYFI